MGAIEEGRGSVVMGVCQVVCVDGAGGEVSEYLGYFSQRVYEKLVFATGSSNKAGWGESDS